MALTYGFYDSVNHDRVYNARQFNSFLDGVINDGVFRTVGTRFTVTKVDGENWKVKVGSGKAFLNKIWTYNDSDDVILDVDPRTGNYKRCDSVIIKVDENSRTNSIEIKKGTDVASTTADADVPKPELVDEGGVHEYRLANILISNSDSSISPYRITNCVGTDTPFTMFSDLPYATNYTYGLFNAGDPTSSAGTYYEFDPGIRVDYLIMASVRYRSGSSNEYYYPYPDHFIKYGTSVSSEGYYPTTLGIITRRFSSRDNFDSFWVDSALNGESFQSHNPKKIIREVNYYSNNVLKYKIGFDKHYWFGYGYRFWLAIGRPYETQ